MYWCAGTPCTGVFLPVKITDPLPAFLCRAGTANAWSPAAPCPRTAPIDKPPVGSTQASYWWLCKALLREAKGDTLASHFNRRQPIVRQVPPPGSI